MEFTCKEPQRLDIAMSEALILPRNQVEKLIKNIAAQPCKDCHNHEMRNGQKFFEPVTAQAG